MNAGYTVHRTDPYRQHAVLRPQLPRGITRLRFTVRWQGLRLVVDIEPQQVTYILRDGPDATMCLRHAGTEITVTTGRPLTSRLQKRRPLLSRPPQPPGRQPAPHGGWCLGAHHRCPRRGRGDGHCPLSRERSVHE